MAKIKSIERRNDRMFWVTLDQEIWDSFAKTERQTFAVIAKDELEAYNITMEGIWHGQCRARQGIY